MDQTVDCGSTAVVDCLKSVVSIKILVGSNEDLDFRSNTNRFKPIPINVGENIKSLGCPDRYIHQWYHPDRFGKQTTNRVSINIIPLTYTIKDGFL